MSIVKRKNEEMDEFGGDGSFGNFYEYSMTDKPFMSSEREYGPHKFMVPVIRQGETKILTGDTEKSIYDQYVTAYSQGWREYEMTRDEAARVLKEAPGGLTQLYIGGKSVYIDRGKLYTPPASAPNDGQVHQGGAGGALGTPDWLRNLQSWWNSLWNWSK